MYIGSSLDWKRRTSDHATNLDKRSHTNRGLQADWVKYGAQAFTFCFIEQCHQHALVVRERYWIERFRPTGVYNTAKAFREDTPDSGCLHWLSVPENNQYLQEVKDRQNAEYLATTDKRLLKLGRKRDRLFAAHVLLWLNRNFPLDVAAYRAAKECYDQGYKIRDSIYRKAQSKLAQADLALLFAEVA